MFLAKHALAHVHDFCALLAAVYWRIACYTAGCGVWVGVRVLVECQLNAPTGGGVQSECARTV